MERTITTTNQRIIMFKLAKNVRVVTKEQAQVDRETTADPSIKITKVSTSKKKKYLNHQKW
jgi:hypothetical protein